VIKDQARTHVAARIIRESGDVVFVDDTVPVFESATWVFDVLEATPEEAIKEAVAMNVKRRLSR
jgi:hypothetical protein